jgi:hypothetical protein
LPGRFYTCSPDGVGKDILRFRFALAAISRVTTSRFFDPSDASPGQKVLNHIFQQYVLSIIEQKKKKILIAKVDINCGIH